MPAELLNDTNQNQNGVDVLSPPIQVPVFGEEYTYDPTGRRDPFNPPKAFIREANKPGQIVRPKTQAPIPEGADPLQRMDLDKAMLVGIIWEVANPRAMLVDVGDPTHTVYIVTKKTKVGRNNGYVSAIREGELVIIESFEEDGIINQIPRILSLKKDQK